MTSERWRCGGLLLPAVEGGTLYVGTGVEVEPVAVHLLRCERCQRDVWASAKARSSGALDRCPQERSRDA